MSDIQRYSLNLYRRNNEKDIVFVLSCCESVTYPYSSHFTPALCNNIIENVILGLGFQSEAYLRGGAGGGLSHPIIYCFKSAPVCNFNHFTKKMRHFLPG